jgi:hypothetical protein
MAGKQRIGVLTFHRCINYGSYWQARALVEGLRGRGHDAELLDHRDRAVTWAEWRCAFQPTLPLRAERSDLPLYGQKARRFLQAFDDLPESAPFDLHSPGALQRYDSIVVGSDEVWNLAHPWYGGKPLFYGHELPAERVVSYAASFGNYSCHWGIGEEYADHLKRFDCLSVRDENSYWLVRGSTGREPAMVLDPVLQWPEVSAVAAREDAPYLLLYGHGFPDWYLLKVRDAANAQGLRLVSIGYRNPLADEQRLSAGPLEFAQAVAGASALATNFFHGAVFALRHGKPFAAVSTPYRHNKLRDLMAAVGVEERLVMNEPANGLLTHLLAEPLAPEVGRHITDLRRQSNAYLDDALA